MNWAKLIEWAPWAAVVATLLLKFIDVSLAAKQIEKKKRDDVTVEEIKQKSSDAQFLITQLRTECERAAGHYDAERSKRDLAEARIEDLKDEVVRIKDELRRERIEKADLLTAMYQKTGADGLEARYREKIVAIVETRRTTLEEEAIEDQTGSARG